MPLTEKQFATINRRLERVADKIIKHPETYDQNTPGRPCGCIGNHLIARLKIPSFSHAVMDKRRVVDIWLFGFTGGGEDWRWPDDLANAYNSATTPAGRARIGVRAINRYLRERRKEVVK